MQINCKNQALTQEFLDITRALSGDIKSRKDQFNYLQNSTAIVHHRVISTSYVPKLYDQASYDYLKYIAETFHGILCKVIQRYLDDPEYRQIFDYDERLVDLILLPRNYDALLPFCRLDVFLNEENFDLGFCEFNADGSSGMNENRELSNSYRHSQALAEFAQAHDLQFCELFESWVKEFLAIYDTYAHKVENPHVCICDFLENGVVDEFKIFCEIFGKFGIDASICDVRDLRFTGEELLDDQGKPVHAIWRRSVTNDIIDNWEGSQELIAAVRAEKVALIGSFAGHIVHDKQIFEALFHPLTQAFLSSDEIELIEKTIPQTRFLDEAIVDLHEIRTTKDKWIIKPTDAYGAADVYAGCFYTQEEWDALVSKYANSAQGAPFLVQRYITPFKTPVIPPDHQINELPENQVSSDTELYNNLEGLYLYNGQFAGIFSRLGPYPTISKPMKGITCATIWVDCKDTNQAFCRSFDTSFIEEGF